MKIMRKLVILFLIVMTVSGCGETLRGVGRDASRIWYGTKTIFVSSK